MYIIKMAVNGNSAIAKFAESERKITNQDEIENRKFRGAK